MVDLLNCDATYGYITKYNRVELGLEKSHVNDAFVIAKGRNQERCQELKITQKRRNNRKLQLNRKGFKPSIRRRRYDLQPKDLVKIEGRIFSVIGTHCKGTRVMINCSGKKVSKSIKSVKWKYHFGSFIYNYSKGGGVSTTE